MRVTQPAAALSAGARMQCGHAHLQCGDASMQCGYASALSADPRMPGPYTPGPVVQCTAVGRSMSRCEWNKTSPACLDATSAFLMWIKAGHVVVLLTIP